MRGELGVGRERALCRAIGMQVRDLLQFDVLKAGAGRPDSRTDASARIDSTSDGFDVGGGIDTEPGRPATREALAVTPANDHHD